MYRFIYLLLFTIPFVSFAQIKPTKEYLMHLDAAKSHNVGIVKDKAHLNKLSKKGTLVSIKQRGYGYRIDNLTHSHAYLVPKGRTFLTDLARDFVKQAGQNFFVVTSLTRTEADQNRLRKVNSNASSNESSHSFGAALDISYIRFNHKKEPNLKLEKILEDLLKQYQNTGKIYFVKERKSRCFHIIIR